MWCSGVIQDSLYCRYLCNKAGTHGGGKRLHNRGQYLSMMEKSSASHVSILRQDLCNHVCVRTSLFGVNETSEEQHLASKKNTLAAVVKQEAGRDECGGVTQVVRRSW